MNFSLRSVRAKLTLWNVGILALTLIVLGFAFRVSMEYTGIAEVDRTLAGAAHSMREMENHPPPQPPGPQPPGPQPRGLLPPGPQPPENNPPDRRGDGRDLTRDEPQHAPRRRRGAGPLGSFQPRFLNLKGETLFAPPDEHGQKVPPWDPSSFALSAKGQEVSSTIPNDQVPLRVLSVPIRREGKIIGVAQLTSPLEPLQTELARLTGTLLTLIPLALLIAGLGGAFLTNRALRPVRELGLAAGRIEASDLSQRLPNSGGDEFAVLATTFNGMLSRLESAFHAMEAAYEQQRQFTADASHELRTPLTIIKANTSLALLNGGTAADYRCALEAADLGADRTIRLIQDLLLLARADAGSDPMHRECVPLGVVLTQAAEAALAARHHPHPDLDHPHTALHLPAIDLNVSGDEHSLRRLFSNLLENALRHTSPDGTVTVTAEQQGAAIVVKIIDTGEGIALVHLPHLFDRFYRADSARSGATGGTGLGLAICRSIVEAHGGAISLESVAGVGTTVTVTLPAA